MNCLIIGYGSIGKKHAKVLAELNCKINLVTLQNIEEYPCFKTIEDAFEKQKIDYIIISNSTDLHYLSLLSVIKCKFKGIVLVEKPLFPQFKKLPPFEFKLIIAYNMRFNELLRETKNLLNKENLISFSAYVGQYLPTWRNGRDYRKVYSANKDQGGGVLRDLSHELDYCLWFCGFCIDVTAIGGQFSQLEITSDDTYSILMKCEKCPIVNIHLNYLDRYPKRELTINTFKSTIHVDLIEGLLRINEKIILQNKEAAMQSYVNQHTAILNHDFNECCSYEEGCRVVKLIEAIEFSAVSKNWISI